MFYILVHTAAVTNTEWLARYVVYSTIDHGQEYRRFLLELCRPTTIILLNDNRRQPHVLPNTGTTVLQTSGFGVLPPIRRLW